MWYPASVTVAPASEPVSAAEVAAHLRADLTAEADLRDLLIAAARDHVQARCGIRLVTQTLALKCDAFDDLARLPEAPVQSVTSVAYVDTAGDPQTLAGTVYELRADALDAAIVLKHDQSWPAIQPGSRITVTLVAGYAAVPPALKHALLLHIAQAYEKREDGEGYGASAMESLLSNFRRGA